MFRKICYIVLVFFCSFSVYSAQSNVSGGINLTFDVNTSSSQIIYDNGYPITNLNEINITSTTYDTNQVNYQFKLSNMPSDSRVYIATTKGSLSGLLCNTTYSSSNIQSCSFTYPDSWKSSEPILYFYTHNLDDSYSLSTAQNFYQRDEVQQYRGGLNLIFKTNTSSTQINYNNNYPITQFDSINITSTTYEDNQVNYDFKLSNMPSDSIVYIATTKGSLSGLLCNTTYSSSNIQSCSFTYPDSWKSSEPILYFYTHNLDDSYSLSTAQNFYQRDEVQQYRGGLSLTYNIFQNITSLTMSNPYYVSPTPEHNQRNSYRQNITIKVHDGNQNLDSCQVEINNNTYPMPYDDTHCIYTYSINESNTTQTIEFQSSYTISSIESSLQKRTIYIYPDRETENKVPGFGVASLLIALLLILGGLLK